MRRVRAVVWAVWQRGRGGSVFLRFEFLNELTECVVGEAACCVMSDAGIGSDHDKAREDTDLELCGGTGSDVMVGPFVLRDLVFGEEGLKFAGGHLEIGANEERLDALFLEELGAFGGACKATDAGGTPRGPEVQDGDLALEGGFPFFGFLDIDEDEARGLNAFGDGGFGLVEHSKCDKSE